MIQINDVLLAAAHTPPPTAYYPASREESERLGEDYTKIYRSCAMGLLYLVQDRADAKREIGQLTQGYSGADMANLCKEAAMGPIRSMDFSQIQRISKAELRKISFQV